MSANDRPHVKEVQFRPGTFLSGSKASADTAKHALSAQPVSDTVFIKAKASMTGNVTISDGTNGGVVLIAGESLPVSVRDLNQIYYQFSVNAGTEVFAYVTGV